MAYPTATDSRRGGHSPDLFDLAFWAVAWTSVLVMALPLLLVAAPVYVFFALTRASRPLAVLAVAALLALAGAWAVRQGLDVRAAPAGYVELQVGAGLAALAAVREGTGIGGFPWLEYARGVWPYALAGGLALAALVYGFRLFGGGAFVLSDGGFARSEAGHIAPTALRFYDAGRLADEGETPVPWALPRVVGLGVVSLLSAPPGLGKGWWTWGLLRAMQDGATFFGLPARRPARATLPLGLRKRPARVLWCTEEGESFKATARRFGIARGWVQVLRRDEVQGRTWAELLREVRHQAWRRRCGVVIFDTIRAWCPQAEVSNDQAAAVMNLARAELARPGLGVLFVHHDRKGGGEYGEGVAGAYNLVGSCDVLIELKRVKGRPDARRMLVSRRFGDLDATATLRGHRYVADGAPPDAEAAEAPPAPAPPTPPAGAGYGRYLRSEAWAGRRAEVLERARGRCERCGEGAPVEVHHLTYARLGHERPEDLAALCADCHRGAHPPRARKAAGVPVHLRGTLARVEQAGEIASDALLEAEGGARSSLHDRLRELERLGLVARRGRGVKGDPVRWRATRAP